MIVYSIKFLSINLASLALRSIMALRINDMKKMKSNP